MVQIGLLTEANRTERERERTVVIDCVIAFKLVPVATNIGNWFS